MNMQIQASKSREKARNLNTLTKMELLSILQRESKNVLVNVVKNIQEKNNSIRIPIKVNPSILQNQERGIKTNNNKVIINNNQYKNIYKEKNNPSPHNKKNVSNVSNVSNGSNVSSVSNGSSKSWNGFFF